MAIKKTGFLGNSLRADKEATIDQRIEHIRGMRVSTDVDLVMFITDADYEDIGETVIPMHELSKTTISNISAVTRRKANKKNIVLYVTADADPDDCDSGVIFTDTSIIAFTDEGKAIDEVKYVDITNVDFDDDSVEIVGKNGGITFDSDESRHIYNFIMDIVDFLSEKEDKEVKDASED